MISGVPPGQACGLPRVHPPNKEMMMARRDMSKKQFLAALDRHDITDHLTGYYAVRHDLMGRGTLCIYARNGGNSYREMLAYLLKEKEKAKHS